MYHQDSIFSSIIKPSFNEKVVLYDKNRVYNPVPLRSLPQGHSSPGPRRGHHHQTDVFPGNPHGRHPCHPCGLSPGRQKAENAFRCISLCQDNGPADTAAGQCVLGRPRGKKSGNGIFQRYNPGRSTPCSLHIPNKNVPQDQMSCGTSAFLLVGTYSCAAPSAAASGRSQLVIIPPSSSKVAVFTIWDLPTRISWVPSSLDRLSFTVPSMVKTRL